MQIDADYRRFKARRGSSLGRAGYDDVVVVVARGLIRLLQ